MDGFRDFNKRSSLGDELNNALGSFFCDDEVELIPYGVEKRCDNDALKKYIASVEVNYSRAGMMVKFSPDFILLTKSRPQRLYFVEAKVSITPLCYPNIIREIETKHQRKIPVSNIGVIAREAWNAYKTFYPNLIIVSASTYNPQLLKAQFLDKITCLRCYNGAGKSGYDCAVCPLKSQGFFPYERNYYSSGSQTPQTNVDLASFEDFEEFFASLNITTKHDNIENFKQKMIRRGVFFKTDMDESLKENIAEQLKKEGCTWVK